MGLRSVLRTPLLAATAACMLAACSTNTAGPAKPTLAIDQSASSTSIVDSPLCDRLPKLDDEQKRAVLENDPEYLHEAVARLAGSISSCYLRYENDPRRAELAIIRYATAEQAIAARDALAKDWENQIANQPATASDGSPELSTNGDAVVKRYGTSAAVVSATGSYFILGYSATASYLEGILEGITPYVSTN